MVTDPSDPHDGWTADGRAAFAQLFATCFEPVRRYVQRQMPVGEEAATDIAHEVFFRVWTQHVTLDPTRSPLPFLCTLARRVAIDHWRREQVENRFARQCVQAAELDGPPVADDPERELLHQEQLDLIRRALAKLAPRQREVAVMRWGERQGRAEIARRLKISPKTVAMHLTRAKAHLRKTLPVWCDLD